MTTFRQLVQEIDFAEDDTSDDLIEVYADSVKQALQVAAEAFDADVLQLDYQILKKGSSGFLGMGRLPYRVLVRKVIENEPLNDMEDLEAKLMGSVPGASLEDKKDKDGYFIVQVIRKGVMLRVYPSKGKGSQINSNQVIAKLAAMRIEKYDSAIIDLAVEQTTGERMKIAEWEANPIFDSTMKIEISKDEMRAFVHITPPRYNGRTFEIEDIVGGLSVEGVVKGIDEDRIQKYLDAANYDTPLLAAEGQKPVQGQDSRLDYKVRINRGNIVFGEDDDGNVDFKNLELIENVVAGQLLAIKLQPDRGITGFTVKGKETPVRAGKEVPIKFGSGVMLSSNGIELTAQMNGQVVFKREMISVENVHLVSGDVGPRTGNINFLGSVMVTGNVLDNYAIKATGNIEVKGTVQKAFLESEADIIVNQGISGRNEAKVESTGGSVFAKFIQSANVIAAQNVFSPEGILHSNIDAGDKIISLGKKAKIISGTYRAGTELNVKFVGGEGGSKTEIWAGVDPKILTKQNSLEDDAQKLKAELEEIENHINAMNTQKRAGKLTEEKEARFQELTEQQTLINEQIETNNKEIEEINSVIEKLPPVGIVCIEKKITRGVSIFINGSSKRLDTEFNNVKFIQSTKKQKLKNIKTGKYEEMYTIQVENYEPPTFDKISPKMAGLMGGQAKGGK